MFPAAAAYPVNIKTPFEALDMSDGCDVIRFASDNTRYSWVLNDAGGGYGFKVNAIVCMYRLEGRFRFWEKKQKAWEKSQEYMYPKQRHANCVLSLSIHITRIGKSRILDNMVTLKNCS